jgi:phage tail sheath protein FI
VSSDPSWRFVNVRRLLLMIEEAVDQASQWAVFEPIDFFLLRRLEVAIGTLLRMLWSAGALAGAAADEAFFVRFDDTFADASEGSFVGEVGVAVVAPAEFVVFRVGRTAGTLEVAE